MSITYQFRVLESSIWWGKNSNLQPADSTSSLLFTDRWKLALSSIKTCPGFRLGIKTSFSQMLNSSELQVPPKHIGDRSFPLFKAEMKL